MDILYFISEKLWKEGDKLYLELGKKSIK